MPIKDSNQSRIWLLVEKDLRLSQMVSQVEKLEDVQEVNYSENLEIFEEMSRFMQ